MILACLSLVLLAGVLVDRAVLTSTPRAHAAQPLVPASPSEILSISSRNGDDAAVKLERRVSGWVGSAGTSVWPADMDRVAAGLRLLAQAQAVPGNDNGDGGAAWIAPESTVVITHDSGTVSLGIGSRTIAGTRAALIDGSPAAIPESIARMLEPESLGLWLAEAVLPGLSGDARFLRIETEGGAIRLDRVGRAWGLQEPVRTPADAEAVASLIGTLGSLRFVERIDGEARFEPVMTVEAESPSSRWEVAIGEEGLATAAWSVGEQSHRIIGRIDATALEQAPLDARALISPIALDLPASDVESLRLVSEDSTLDLLLRRAARSWSSDAEFADALLRLLTIERCDEVSIGQTTKSVIRVEIERFGGLPVSAFGLTLATETDASARISVTERGVSRAYAADDATTPAGFVAAWLRDASR